MGYKKVSIRTDDVCIHLFVEQYGKRQYNKILMQIIGYCKHLRAHKYVNK